MRRQPARVLLISPHENLREPVARALEDGGYDVVCCPGPSAPTYLCLGGRGERCPLASDADVVVLDGWLASDQARSGAPSWHLFLYYANLGLPIVALVGPNGLPGKLPEGTRALSRHASAAKIVAAVDSLVPVAASG